MNEPASLLVVDDDENDLRMMQGVLAQGENPPSVAFMHDGAEALDYLLARGAFADRVPGSPRLMILDLHMPRVNGWEVLRQVKSDPRLRTIPIVIFSSSARESDVAQSYELGANAYVVKPIDFEEFRRTIDVLQAFWLARNQVSVPPRPRSPAFTTLPPPRRPAGRTRTKPEPA